MNAEWLGYAIRLTVVWSVLLLFYQLLLRDNRDWRWRRYFLVGTYLAGFLIPLLPAWSWSVEAYQYFGWSGRVVVGPEGFVPSAQANLFVDERASVGFPWWVLVGCVWLAGVSVQVIRTLVALAQCYHWRRTGKLVERNPHRVVRHPSVPGPCTAWGCIFLPLDWPDSMTATAMLHERIHLRKGHERERLLLLPVQILAWFHPLVWWLSAELEAVQEYETDAAVVQQVSLKTYGRTLLHQVAEVRLSATLDLFSSPLKKRIAMLTSKTPGRPWHRHYTLGLLGILFILVLACTDTVTETLPATATLSLDDYSQVEEPPRLLNLEYANALDTTEPERLLLDYVYRNIRYPVAARQADVEEMYNVTFLIDASGILRDLEINRTDDKSALSQNRIVVIGYGASGGAKTDSPAFTGQELSTEVERVMQSLPEWQPARQAGQAVPVRMQLSFDFTIER